MASINDGDIQKSIEKLSESLKSLVKSPDWALFVKTGAGKERPPVDLDWFYKRSASVLITIYRRGPIGVAKLRVKYGSRKRRGHKPAKFCLASGKIIRNVMQQLEKAELVINKKDGIHKGRIVLPKGKSLVDKSTVR
ncbi:40S ribosomal protein S19 [Candidatus Woesearchaeota archaeon]|nr:MAG: 30S ribosomal protein S19, small subunit ribosomal protein S19e [archaeon GW2011_AR18]MBS3161586.1 40S ribosomal protein S19 [Candidatus Woesearchaeota archaeon]HIH26121.1 40S ribosomal protein S19 [Nanoarchaeota archaeon]